MGGTVTLRFGASPEEQEKARGILGAMMEGQRDRENKVPLHTDDDGRPVYRILMRGLYWVSDGKGLSCYRAYDGAITWKPIPGSSAKVQSCERVWAVGRDAGNKWGVCLHDGREGSPHIIASGLRTFREAKAAAEHEARRMPWIEGAPW